MASSNSAPPVKKRKVGSPTWYDLRKTIVNLRVEDVDIPFYKELLCRYSKVFKTMFDRQAGSGTFAETEAGAVVLEEESKVIIQHFQRWLDSREYLDGTGVVVTTFLLTSVQKVHPMVARETQLQRS